MKVILTKDFEKLGSLGDIVNVKDGYAQNYLIPNKIVIPATKGNIKQMEIVRNSYAKKEAKNINQAKEIAERLKGLEIIFKVKTSPDGKLYGSVTNKDITDEILKHTKVEVDKRKIELDSHLKEPGGYDVDIRLYKDVKSRIKVIIESESVEEEEREDNGNKEGQESGEKS